MTSVSVNSSSFTVTVNETTNVVTISSPYTVNGDTIDDTLPKYVYGNRDAISGMKTGSVHCSWFGDSLSNSGETDFTSLFHAALFEWHPDQWRGAYFHMNASGVGPYVSITNVRDGSEFSYRQGRQYYGIPSTSSEIPNIGNRTSSWIRGGKAVDLTPANPGDDELQQISLQVTANKLGTTQGARGGDILNRFPTGKGIFVDASGERSIGSTKPVSLGVEVIGHGTTDFCDTELDHRIAAPGLGYSGYSSASVSPSSDFWVETATRSVSGSHSPDGGGSWNYHLRDLTDSGKWLVCHSAFFGSSAIGFEMSYFGDGGYRIRNHYPPGESITIGSGGSEETQAFHYDNDHLVARMNALGTSHAMIFLGMNDVSGAPGRNASEVLADYDILLGKIRAAKPRVKIIALTLYRTGDGTGTGSNRGDNDTQAAIKNEVNAGLIARARASTDMAVIDINEYIRDTWNPDGSLTDAQMQQFFYTFWLNDPTHFNTTGASAIAGFIWEKVVECNRVDSVNGKTGVVEITADDISDFTDTARAAMSVTGTGLSYNSSTGQIASLSTSVVTLNAGTSANNLVQLDGSAKLPAVDGSQLTNLPSGGGGGNDYLSKPTYTGNQVRLFDDFYSVVPDVGPNDGNNQWWMFSGGSSVSPADRVEAGARGVGLHNANGASDRYTYWGGMFLQNQNKADGDELLWESRVKLIDGSSVNGSITTGVVNRTNSLNKNDAPPTAGYSTFEFSALVASLSRTNLVTSVKTTSGGGSPTVTDLGGSYPLSSYVDGWFRWGVHCKYNATDDDYDIQFYINGSTVGSVITMNFDDAIIPFIGMSNPSTYNSPWYLYIDWISYTVKIGSEVSGRTTVLDMDSL